jgi:hypothetical protein
LHRWLRLPGFQKAYRQARRQLVEGAISRIQAGTGQAVDTLLTVATNGKKDSDRVRAAGLLLDHALHGLTDCHLFQGDLHRAEAEPMGTADVVKILAGRLLEIDTAELPTVEKARLTASLSDALLRAIGVDILDKRMEALQTVLIGRKEK